MFANKNGQRPCKRALFYVTMLLIYALKNISIRYIGIDFVALVVDALN